MKTHMDILTELQRQINGAVQLPTVPMSAAEQKQFKAERPWADLRVGDFEIRVINREKFGLDPQ